MRVLLVEDDECIAKTLETALIRENYAVDVAFDGEVGWRLIEAFTYDLILLDVMLPKRDGITLCRQLRQHNYQTPVLLLTAQNSSTDRIAGLDAGADDYMVKPFEFPELLARIRVLLRRGNTPVLPVLEWNRLRLDLTSCTASYGDRPLQLTPKEYRLLELFLRNPYRVFTRSSILEHLWGLEETPGEDTVTAHIKGVRHKLKQVGAPATLIETVYGMGYRLKQAPVDPDSAPEATGAVDAPDGNMRHSAQAASRPPAPEASAIQDETRAEQIRRELEAGWQRQTRWALRQVWTKYAAQNRARLQILEQAIMALQNRQLNEELQHQAHVAAHKLAGALGVFECPNGSRLATELEQGLRSHPSEQTARHLVDVFAALQQEMQQIADAPPQTGSPMLSTPLHPLKLLVIDDDPQLVNRLRHIATVSTVEWNETVPLAESLEVALSTAKEAASESPSILILHLSLAAHLEEYLTQLRDLTYRIPPVSVVLFTDRADLALRLRLAEAGIQVVLPKTTAEQVMQIAQPSPCADPLGRIMIVDDDPQMLDQMQTVLEPWGLQLTSLRQVTQFWQVLQSETPDLLILDVEMPEVNGITLCRAIRSVPRWQRLPILFLTVHTDAATLRQMLDAGADALISKPITESDVILRVLGQLERSRMQQTICL